MASEVASFSNVRHDSRSHRTALSAILINPRRDTSFVHLDLSVVSLSSMHSVDATIEVHSLHSKRRNIWKI